MSLQIGRTGYLGLAIESVAGTAESTPSIFYPTTEDSIEAKHEKLVNISTRANRIKDYDSVAGKKWGEGDISAYLDASNAGYLFKLAFGQETKTNVATGVDNHQFYVTASGNTAKTATLWQYRGSDPSVQRYTRMAVDTLELEVMNDDIATMTASFMGSENTAVSAPALTTTSGTVFTWANASLKLGDTVASARNATATKVTNFKLTVNNNLEMLYRAGSNSVDEITLGECEVSGEYTLFFENDTEFNAYMNNTKRALVLTLTGADLGTAFEQLEICLERIFLEDKSIETGQDSLFAITANFRALQTNVGYVTVNLRNGKQTVY